MISIHEWTMQPYEEPHVEKDVQVILPNYWFHNGTGNIIVTLDITVLGTITISDYQPLKAFADVQPFTEYGTVQYKGETVKVVAPFPGVHEHWRYYGNSPDLERSMKLQQEQLRKKYEE